MKRIVGILAVMLIIMQPVASEVNPEIVVQKVEGDFFDVRRNIHMAIVGKGINIAHILPASDMLSRTASAYGYSNDVYSDAETYEFCSAQLSQKLARLNPDNIVACPFTISVYALTAEPGYVRIAYKVPTTQPGAQKVLEEAIELIEGIIEDATAWN
jgi:hypothetical protein